MSVALRVLVLSLAAACAAGATDQPAAVAGIYESNTPVKGTGGHKVTLTLAQDGKATLRSEIVGKDVTTNSGAWSAAKDELKVEFDGGAPAPMIWKINLPKGRLTPREKHGLTLRRPH